MPILLGKERVKKWVKVMCGEELNTGLEGKGC